MENLLNEYDQSIKKGKDLSIENIKKIAADMNNKTLALSIIKSRTEYPSLTKTLTEILEKRMENMEEGELYELTMFLSGGDGRGGGGGSGWSGGNGGGGGKGFTSITTRGIGGGVGFYNPNLDTPAPIVRTYYKLPAWFFYGCSVLSGGVIGSLLTYAYLEFR